MFIAITAQNPAARGIRTMNDESEESNDSLNLTEHTVARPGHHSRLVEAVRSWPLAAIILPESQSVIIVLLPRNLLQQTNNFAWRLSMYAIKSIEVRIYRRDDSD